jgi:hypothetical protein
MIMQAKLATEVTVSENQIAVVQLEPISIK